MTRSTHPAATPDRDAEAVAGLARFVRARRPLFVLTGAGCSTESGLPAYRDERGAWKHAPPMVFEEFRHRAGARRRYWARNMAAWPRLAAARPNRGHEALTRLERAGHVAMVVTQNVDRLHQRAGSHCVVDLHGRIDRVRCLDCEARIPRHELQRRLERDNPHYRQAAAPSTRPDGDADLGKGGCDDFHVPHCERCGGMLKPDVVFFGEAVPRSDVELAESGLDDSRGMLVVGSSLTVYSGRRLCIGAQQLGLPLAVVNRGWTRADAQAALKVDGPCGPLLSRLADALGA